MSTPLPLGDIEFFDNDVPGVAAGNYWITVEQAIEHAAEAGGAGARIDAGDMTPAQEFVVSAPQFALPPEDIVSVHPAAGSTGKFAEQLPHIVFSEPALPWERAMQDPSHAEPWLALLVLTDDELPDGSGPTHTTKTTVDDFLTKSSDVYKPNATREDDIDPDSPVSYITLSTEVFTAVTPRLTEARYLAHCRQANISDKAAQNLDPNGFFAIVAANRFPAAPPPGSGGATKNIVHLVSLEGLDTVLVDAPDFGSATSVALVSLASWTFQCQADNAVDFAGLTANLVASESTPSADAPDRLWLRVPTPDALADDDAGDEVKRRLEAGFVPLSYHTRSGEDTFAWHRGPFTPVLTTPLATTTPFFTADAALAYDAAFGVFDTSYATAWEAGRAAALADRAFGQLLYELRRRSHALTDGLLQRLQSTYHFTQTDIESLDADTTVQDALLSVLHADLIASIGETQAVPTGAAPRAAPAPSPTNPKDAVREFFADPAVQQIVAALVADEMVAVARWLARLLLLYPLPFNLLVPDARMLPVESLRFFYVDPNWTGALMDGALSIGLESSRQTFYQEVMRGMLQRAARDAADVYRSGLIGSDPPPTQSHPTLISGILLRSALVSGWPTLAVRPYLADGTTQLKTLRMDHVSPSVLLCLFSGVPERLELSEPQEAFRFGVDDDGNAVLRNLVAPATSGDPAIGKEVTQFSLYDPKGLEQRCTRAPGTRVLELAPDDSSGAVQQIHAALGTAAPPLAAFGPAAFALQMIKSPEAIQFSTGAAS